MPSSTSAHFDIPGAHTHYDNRVDADVFRVYVTWDDWQYYSTQVWKVSTIFVVFVSDAGSYQATTDYMRNKYMDISCNSVGWRKSMLSIYYLGL